MTFQNIQVKLENAFSMQQETLCDSAVTDETFCFLAVTG